MKTMVIRLVMFLALALLAVGVTAQDQVYNADFNIGPAVGADSCAKCYITGGFGNGSMVMYCGAPQSGELGMQYCQIYSYPEGSYCVADGNECCVD